MSRCPCGVVQLLLKVAVVIAIAITIAAVSVTATTATASGWLPPIVTRGNKLFDSSSGREFRIKGIAYYPRPNGGEFARGAPGYDWAADEHEGVWGPHLKVMQELGVNTIRLYAVDPTKPHDKFMCAAASAGIYVLVGMAAPCENCAVPEYAPPKCYPPELLERVQLIYNAFAVYDNTLAFSVGNENNMPTRSDSTGRVTAPCVKALLRDAKDYARSCTGTLRQVPIGLDLADIQPRRDWVSYYDCLMDQDPSTSADWLGFNPYVECDPLKHSTYAQSTGLQELMKNYRETNYSRPIMFGEFGCNKGANTLEGYENQRSFYDAKWMNEAPEMMVEVVGGSVFEFSTELANLEGKAKKISKEKDTGRYGVGYFTPDDCDHDAIPCKFNPYPEFENLKSAYSQTPASTLTLNEYKPARDRLLSCPASIVFKLPPTPTITNLKCSALQPVCGGKPSNTGSKGSKAIVVDNRIRSDGSGPVEVTNSTAHSDGSSRSNDGGNEDGSTGIRGIRDSVAGPDDSTTSSPTPGAKSSANFVSMSVDALVTLAVLVVAT